MTPEQRRFIESLDRDGNITPDELVEAAEPPDSPIHDLFTWDDAIAGGRWRRQEARTLIRLVKVGVVENVREIRAVAYVRNPELPSNEQGYVRTRLLRSREEAAADALDAEIQRVASFIHRARRVAEGLGLSDLCEVKLQGLLATPAMEDVA